MTEAVSVKWMSGYVYARRISYIGLKKSIVRYGYVVYRSESKECDSYQNSPRNGVMKKMSGGVSVPEEDGRWKMENRGRYRSLEGIRYAYDTRTQSNLDLERVEEARGKGRGGKVVKCNCNCKSWSHGLINIDNKDDKNNNTRMVRYPVKQREKKWKAVHTYIPPHIERTISVKSTETSKAFVCQ